MATLYLTTLDGARAGSPMGTWLAGRAKIGDDMRYVLRLRSGQIHGAEDGGEAIIYPSIDAAIRAAACDVKSGVQLMGYVDSPNPSIWYSGQKVAGEPALGVSFSKFRILPPEIRQYFHKRLKPSTPH